MRLGLTHSGAGHPLVVVSFSARDLRLILAALKRRRYLVHDSPQLGGAALDTPPFEHRRCSLSPRPCDCLDLPRHHAGIAQRQNDQHRWDHEDQKQDE